MKLKFREGMLDRYSFRDLEYGLELLNTELEVVEADMKVLEKYGYQDYQIKRHRQQARKPILDKIKVIEVELTERMLTGNDDGMLERELLGAQG